MFSVTSVGLLCCEITLFERFTCFLEGTSETLFESSVGDLYKLPFLVSNQNETRTFYDRTTSRIQSYGIDALGYIPLGCDQKFELVGGLGIGSYELKTRSEEYRDKDEGIGYRMSAGVQYNVTDNMAIRGMYRHVIVNGSDLDRINEYSAGIRYMF